MSNRDSYEREKYYSRELGSLPIEIPCVLDSPEEIIKLKKDKMWVFNKAKEAGKNGSIVVVKEYINTINLRKEKKERVKQKAQRAPLPNLRNARRLEVQQLKERMKAKRLERKMGEAHEPTSKSVAEEEEAGAGYGTTVIKKGGEEEEAEDPSENGFGTTRIHTEAEDNNNEYGTTVIKTTEDEEEGTLENGYGTTRIHNEAEDNGYGTTVINGLQSQPQASDGTRIVATNSSDKVSEQSQQPETMDITEEEDDVDSSITHIDQKKNEKGQTLLHFAAGEGWTETVVYLISQQASVNTRAADGSTPLHSVARIRDCDRSRSKIAKILVEYGADVNAKDEDGNAPIHLATAASNASIVEALLESKADIDIVNNKGETPLHIACFIGDEKLVTLLHKKHASLDIRTTNDESALLVAAKAGHQQLVEYLINTAKVNIMKKDRPVLRSLKVSNVLIPDDDSLRLRKRYVFMSVVIAALSVCAYYWRSKIHKFLSDLWY